MRNSNKIAIKFWEELRLGDTEALGGLYDLFADDLYGYGTQFTSDKSRIMDAIHDLFLDLYKYRKNLTETNNVKYYLLRSLKNKILKKQQSKVIPLEDNNHIETINSTSSHEEEIVENEHVQARSQKLAYAMSKLSNLQKKGLYLRYNQEYDYKEIANVMGITIESSRTNIYRAIKSLRNDMMLIFLFASIII